MKLVSQTSIRIHAIKLFCAAGLAIMAAQQPAVAQSQKTIAVAVKVAGDRRALRNLTKLTRIYTFSCRVSRSPMVPCRLSLLRT
jgi:hypothetical protein